ncbi:MAG: prolyl oligopeptidase family serine peptidase, partial [Burkholderiaceae bacterium]|nr:prolyl oligopeptidase family serine peptidase [Burkholderiaceae bacterium]
MHPMPGPPATLDARHAKPTARRVARSAAPKAQLLANEPCEWQWPDHDHWLAEQARAHAAEVHTAAERFGIRLPPFDALRAALPARAEYEHRTAGAGHECRRLEYLSDGLRVKGYLWKSRNTGARRRPVVVYNRGGCGEYARLTPRTREGFFDFLDAGFVVVGSQYRGNDGGEGRDEIGGADVNDVINLVALLPRIDCADPGHVFVLGDSRGGMMTCMALARGVAARAAATVGCESDLALNAMRRPELFRIYVERVPGFMHHAPGLLRERSARHSNESCGPLPSGCGRRCCCCTGAPTGASMQPRRSTSPPRCTRPGGRSSSRSSPATTTHCRSTGASATGRRSTGSGAIWMRGRQGTRALELPDGGPPPPA